MNNIAQRVAPHIVKPTTFRKLVTHLNKPGVLLPVILLESTVTGGRTLQAYKRGGYTEARERICEESLGAVFWLFGVKVFNSIGNIIGKKFLGIDQPDFSLAKDSTRNAFENIARDKNLTEAQKKKYIKFKFTKITASVLLAAGFLGFVVPKINQGITRRMLKRDKKKNVNTPEKTNLPQYENINDFISKVAANSTKKPAFKGAGSRAVERLAKITNSLENDDICKLFATDSGVLSGRTYNARNNDERIEILFRDGASIYFYLKSTKHIIKFLNKRDGFGGKLSALDPITAERVHNSLIVQMLRSPGFKNQTIDLELMKRLAYGSDPKKVEEQLEKIKFKNGDVIAFSEFEKIMKESGCDEKTLRKAIKMSKLQPERALDDLGLKGQVGKILTKQQVRDILNDSVVSRPSFLHNVMKDSFDGHSSNVFGGMVEWLGKKGGIFAKLFKHEKDPYGGALFNPYKFVSQESVDNLRKNIDDYVSAIIEYAEKNKINELSPDLLSKVNKMNLRRNAAHIAAGLGVSSLFLSTIIPKIQYLITRIRTGSDNFPGVKDLNN